MYLKIFTYWNDFDNGKEKKPLNDLGGSVY